MYAGHTVNDGTNIASDCWLRWQLRHLAPIVQKVDNTVNQISCYPVDKRWQNKPLYALDGVLSSGLFYLSFNQPKPELSMI